jgi:hypothetical protein
MASGFRIIRHIEYRIEYIEYRYSYRYIDRYRFHWVVHIYFALITAAQFLRLAM